MCICIFMVHYSIFPGFLTSMGAGRQNTTKAHNSADNALNKQPNSKRISGTSHSPHFIYALKPSFFMQAEQFFTPSNFVFCVNILGEG